MPTLDSCVNSVFEPGNIGASFGEVPTTVRVGTLIPPDAPYDPTTLSYSLDFSKFYDSPYIGAF